LRPLYQGPAARLPVGSDCINATCACPTPRSIAGLREPVPACSAGRGRETLCGHAQNGWPIIRGLPLRVGVSRRWESRPELQASLAVVLKDNQPEAIGGNDVEVPVAIDVDQRHGLSITPFVGDRRAQCPIGLRQEDDDARPTRCCHEIESGARQPASPSIAFRSATPRASSPRSEARLLTEEGSSATDRAQAATSAGLSLTYVHSFVTSTASSATSLDSSRMDQRSSAYVGDESLYVRHESTYVRDKHLYGRDQSSAVCAQCDAARGAPPSAAPVLSLTTTGTQCSRTRPA
jgi:hypothetical protein